jgi:single-stranded DNA-binding protein
VKNAALSLMVDAYAIWLHAVALACRTVDVIAWDKLAETSNAYLTKGMPVLVEGRLAIRSYESKSGEKHKAAEVIISLLQMLNRGTSRESNAGIDSAADLELEA